MDPTLKIVLISAVVSLVGYLAAAERTRQEADERPRV
jgi:hypothetical protein